MKTPLFFNSLLCVGLFQITYTHADKLPMIQEKPWIGYFSARENRDFQVGVLQDGLAEMYLMKSRKERASKAKTVKIYPEVIVEDENGNRSFIKLKDEGFVTKLKPSLEHDEVVFQASTSDKARVEVRYKYDDKKLILDGKLLDPGELKGAKLYFGFKVLMPSFYYPETYGSDQDKAKHRMKRDDFRFVRADGEKVKLDVWEVVDFEDEKVAGGGVTYLESDMDAQEGKKFIFYTENKKDAFLIENRPSKGTVEPWRGYWVKWYRPQNEEKGKELSPLVIEVK